MQITIPALLLENTHFKNLPGPSSGTCSAVVGSPNLSGNFTKWVGLEAFTVSVDGDDYTVVSVDPTVMVISPAYHGTLTSNVPFKVYPFVFLRFYPLQPFTAQSDQQIIQPGAPSNGNFYKQASCSVIKNTTYLPEIQLESTTDAINPGDRAARYFAGFYRPDGGLIQPYYRFDQFMLMYTPPVQTWAQIAAYNSPGVPPPPNYDTYNKNQINELFGNSLSDVQVLPPLIFDGETLRIPKASATQDGYLSAEDYQMFVDGMVVIPTAGVTEVHTGTGLTGGTITSIGTISMADQPGVEGNYTNPIMQVNAQGQVVAITSGTGAVDTVAPVVTLDPLNPVTGITGTSVTIHWTTDELSDSSVNYGLDATYGTSTPYTNLSPRVTTHSVTILGLIPNTTYHFQAQSRDATHNIGLQVADATFTTLDTVAPIITPGSVAATSLTLTGATIIWVTNENSDSLVEYGPSLGSYPSSAVPTPNSLVTNHSVPLTALTPGATYHYRVTSRDAALNPVVSGDFTFTTVAPDVTPPTIDPGSIAATGISGTGATIVWTTSGEASDSLVQYGTALGGPYPNSAVPTPNPFATSHSVPLSGLTPSTTYYYKVTSKDAALNPVTSGEQNFPTLDTVAPVISGVSASLIASSSATILWTTSENADSKVEYSADPDVSYGTGTLVTNTPVSTAGVTSHVVSLSSLLSNKLYHYRVRSKDGAGNDAIPVTGTFTTLPAAASPLLTGLVSYWSFDETSGTSMDLFGSNHLVPISTSDKGVITTEVGILGNCRRSSGAGAVTSPLSGGLAAPDSPSLDFSANKSITINGWINLESLQDFANEVIPSLISSWGDSGTQHGWLVYHLSGNWYFAVASYASEQVQVACPSTPTLNQWYMLTAIFDYPNHQISIRVNNGTPVVATFNGPIYHSGYGLHALQFGDLPSNQPFQTKGRIDETGIWERVLTEPEIATLFGGGTTPPPYPFS